MNCGTGVTFFRVATEEGVGSNKTGDADRKSAQTKSFTLTANKNLKILCFEAVITIKSMKSSIF